jgi:hypothetical protein
MPRYYFDWESLGLAERDQRGMKLPNLTAAIELATYCATDIAADDIRRGNPACTDAGRVRYSAGVIVHSVSMAEARALIELKSEVRN